MRRRSAGFASCLIALAVAVGACGAPAATGGHSTFLLGAADAGRTVRVQVGDTVRVALEEDFPVPGSSLVWDVTSSAPSVLQRGAVTRSPKVMGVPGGHDTYSADFKAVGSGPAVLDAHGATTCEAMAKQNCPDRDFTITVIVSS